ncbi:hypothetical protein INT45_011565 [Circinella minor]|uniref:Uncharacterized protein n=1 Tax=Circinella minor TaxID=1195481 RepID=A0A8H7RNF6_9FUNG|nr:hypothetical protein INT45_011565 [Circinella minor]
MDDNFDDFTGRYDSSTAIPVQQVPGRTALASLKNRASNFNSNSTLWTEIGKMHSWINTAKTKFTHFEKLVECQAGIIVAVNKRNAELEQEVHELKHQVAKNTEKKTHSPRDKFLLTADDLSYDWTAEVIEEKLGEVFKNARYRKKLTPQQQETEKQKSQKRSIRNKKYHARQKNYQKNCEALLAEFKDCNRLIEQDLMSDEEDLYDEWEVVEEKAVLCPSWRSDEGKKFYSKLDEMLHQSKKRITGMKCVRGDQYFIEKILSEGQRTHLPSWAIVPLVELPILSVQPNNSEQHNISPVQPEAPSEQ